MFLCVFCVFVFGFFKAVHRNSIRFKKLYPARELDIEMKVDNLSIDDNKIQYAGRSTWAVKE